MTDVSAEWPVGDEAKQSINQMCDKILIGLKYEDLNQKIRQSIEQEKQAGSDKNSRKRKQNKK